MPEIGASHKITHQDGGNDEISVQGLSGTLAETQTPAAHKTSHQDGGADEITVTGLAGQPVFVPYNTQIADINESDINTHFLDLATALSETRTIIGLLTHANRVSGSGSFNVYPNEGSNILTIGSGSSLDKLVIIASGTNRLKYAQSVANDDWNLLSMGYLVVAT